jgi:Na+-transporting NADH:ubiquinone oxidoreductase subunit D
MDAEASLLKKPSYLFFKTKGFSVFVENVWSNNPTFGMVLAICSALAVTTSIKNAFVMGVSVLFSTALSSLIISIIRASIPERVRMITFMLVISTVVISVDKILKIYVPDVSKALGPYVGLIITNCILMGRCEAFAMKNPPWHSVLDGVGAGLGYSLSLVSIAAIRELFGFGSLVGVKVLGEGWANWGLLSIAPGAFFLLGFLTMAVNIVKKRLAHKR